MHAKAFVFILILALAVVWQHAGMPPVTYGSPDEVTQSPTGNSGSWTKGFNAYHDDFLKASESTDWDTHKYFNYDFDSAIPEGSEIDEVLIGLKHYETLQDESIKVRVTWDNEGTWSNWAHVTNWGLPEVLDWIDATTVTEWTRNKLLDANFKLQIQYRHQAGGTCFSPDTMVTMAKNDEGEYEYELMSGLSKGDKVLAYDGKQQVVTKYEEHKDMEPAPHINITTVDNRSLVVWGKHQIPISPFLDTKGVENLTLNDQLLTEDGLMVNISSIETVYLTEFYNIIVSRSLFYANGILIHNAVKHPYTAYLNWIPVKVTYSEGEEEGEEIDCDYIGINNTIAGEPTLFESDWTDTNQTDGLSHWRFYTNNTGSWVNDTWTDVWVNQNWTQTTKTLNPTSGLTIAFRVFINDTSGTEHASTICYFKTQSIEQVLHAGGIAWFALHIEVNHHSAGGLGSVPVTIYDVESNETLTGLTNGEGRFSWSLTPSIYEVSATVGTEVFSERVFHFKEETVVFDWTAWHSLLSFSKNNRMVLFIFVVALPIALFFVYVGHKKEDLEKLRLRQVSLSQAEPTLHLTGPLPTSAYSLRQ